MKLPNEITSQVLENLDKENLKRARLVSTVWCHYASEYLFTKVYISPRKEDIDVFKLITRHPRLSHCVKTLEHDAASFVLNRIREDYFLDLIKMAQDRHFQRLYKLCRARSTDLDPQIDEFVRLCNDPEADFQLAANTCIDYDFMVEGYRDWQARAAYEERCKASGDFLRILVPGLRKLDQLQSIEVNDHWGYITSTQKLKSVEPCWYGSPFGRNRSIFRALPQTNHPNGLGEYCLLTTALSLAEKRLCSFYVGALSPSAFAIKDCVTPELVECSLDAYSRLEHLVLGLAKFVGEPKILSMYAALPGLQVLLKSMTLLKTLRLYLTQHNSCHDDAWFTYDQIFPTNFTWPYITKLNLWYLQINARDLVALLTVRMPNLRHLTLECIELRNGSWEGVIECMQNSMRLLSFGPLGLGMEFLHHGGHDFIGPNAPEDFPGKIGEYVVHGGRHPCLLPAEPLSASQKYLSELEL
ncbi:hypothetical protein MMC28_005738 [Mycoblastus sanguinarius]|nr:hypothetical protein [Mycoblastus sanguinarius]